MKLIWKNMLFCFYILGSDKPQGNATGLKECFR